MAGLFSSPKTPKAPPVVEAPPPTELVDEEAIAKKKKEAMARAQNRGGRQSTILSQAESDTLG